MWFFPNRKSFSGHVHTAGRSVEPVQLRLRQRTSLFCRYSGHTGPILPRAGTQLEIKSTITEQTPRQFQRSFCRSGSTSR